jgi:hypothetical protein
MTRRVIHAWRPRNFLTGSTSGSFDSDVANVPPVWRAHLFEQVLGSRSQLDEADKFASH